MSRFQTINVTRFRDVVGAVPYKIRLPNKILKIKTLIYQAKADIIEIKNRPPRELGSTVWRRIFCVVQSLVSAGILCVLQGKLAKHSAKKTSQTVLFSFRGGLINIGG